jgi:hypothetical protein
LTRLLPSQQRRKELPVQLLLPRHQLRAITAAVAQASLLLLLCVPDVTIGTACPPVGLLLQEWLQQRAEDCAGLLYGAPAQTAAVCGLCFSRQSSCTYI